jgi:hypothetical protein
MVLTPPDRTLFPTATAETAQVADYRLGSGAACRPAPIWILASSSSDESLPRKQAPAARGPDECFRPCDARSHTTRGLPDWRSTEMS